MKRVCIWGGWYGSRNAGDNAILIALINALKKELGDVHISVFSRNTRYIKETYGVQAFAARRQPHKIIWAMSRTNLFIIGGGTPIFDELYQLFSLAVYFAVAKFFRKPIIIYALSVQEIKTRLSKFIIKAILNHVNRITVRETESFKILESLRISNPIDVTVDPAILLKPPKKEEARQIYIRENIKTRRPIIGICPRYFSASAFRKVFHPKIAENSIMNFKQVVARAADYAVSFSDVVFMPMHLEYPDDDRRIANEITGMMKSSAGVYKIESECGPDGIMGVIGEADFIIGIRLHSLIFAAVTGVPMIAISYGPKVKGFMSKLGMEEYAIDIADLNFNWLKEKIDKIRLDKSHVKNKLGKKVDELRTLASHNARLAAELIR